MLTIAPTAYSSLVFLLNTHFIYMFILTTQFIHDMCSPWTHRSLLLFVQPEHRFMCSTWTQSLSIPWVQPELTFYSFHAFILSTQFIHTYFPFKHTACPYCVFTLNAHFLLNGKVRIYNHTEKFRIFLFYSIFKFSVAPYGNSTKQICFTEWINTSKIHRSKKYTFTCTSHAYAYKYPCLFV